MTMVMDEFLEDSRQRDRVRKMVEIKILEENWNFWTCFGNA